jgi:2-haloacid dehalogenase
MTQPKHYQLITFDVYTALFDIDSSLTPAVSEMLDLDGLTFVRAWRRKQMEYALISNSLERGRIAFELITRRALADTLVRCHVTLSESLQTDLLNAWQILQPWPEAASVMDSIKARGYTLGVLSNGDMKMLETLIKRLPPVIEHIFSSEQAGYYKPHPSVYALPLQTLSLAADQVLHVAGSATDALGTKAAGLNCAWSNRNHEPLIDPNYSVDFDMPDLRQLLEIL